MEIAKTIKFSGFGWMPCGELMELFLPIGHSGKNVGVNIAIADAEKMPVKQLEKQIISKTEECYRDRALAYLTQIEGLELEKLKGKTSEELQAMYLRLIEII